MKNKAFTKKSKNCDLNTIFLTGEVIDVGSSANGQKPTARARIKIHNGVSANAFVYIDVYGKRSCADTMAIVCQQGNIVYIEGEFRNATIDALSVKPYVLVKYIECLRRRRDVRPISTDIIKVLDDADPFGYTPSISIKRRRTRKNKEKEED